jgi:hypothetical protein
MSAYVNNDRIADKLIEGPSVAPGPGWKPGPLPPGERHWEHIQLDLTAFKGQSIVIRLYDLILVPGHQAGNSYWKNLNVQ